MKYRIGVDGGGTKTECILIDETGGIVARHLAPGCNPNIVGPQSARQIVTGALEALVAAFRPDSVFAATRLCMAGNPAFWREFAESLAGFGRVAADDDSRPILELATGGGPGLVLHAGTGSFVAARTAAPGPGEASVHYAGGLGWQFGDPGSGYDIGRRAGARALLELQGWMPPSGLGKLLRDHTGLASADAIVRYFYRSPPPHPQMAALAPAVLRLAAGGDEAAQAIVVESASGLLDLALHVAASLFPGAAASSLTAGLSGPLLTPPFVVRELAARSPFPLKPIEDSPIEGVRRLLVRD